jgi:hypothetical protein
MRKFVALIWILLLPLGSIFSQPKSEYPETLLPSAILEEISNEVSGDLALQNEVLLTGVNRNRLPEEYLKGYFETSFILKKLKEYGINDSAIIELPLPPDFKTTWDAEMGELWVVEPEKRKIADLKEVWASLCSGSSSTDVTAELVYVGPGFKEDFYQGKKVKGKIVLVNGYPERARRLAVEKYGALGIVAYSSSHPDFDPDEVGEGSIRPSDKEKKTFGFMVSTRTGNDLRNALERGVKIVVRAVCRAQMVPYKEQMVSALLKGKDFPDEELVFTAHLFEGFAKQGANDNASGCVAILETARAIKKLVDEGKTPPLKRSIRFLFVPEISGTAAYIKKYPEIAKRFFANINEDMVGEAIIKNNGYFCLETTPWSLPSYLNDVVADLIEWVGFNQKQTYGYRGKLMLILSPTGSRDPFYYSIDRYAGGSDHVVFVDGGVRVPAVSFTIWPDMWYHSSGDLPDKSDSTQLKRVAFISVATALFLANAGSPEVMKMIAETSGRALARIGKDKIRAERMLLRSDQKTIHIALKEAKNVINQALAREGEALSSIKFFIKQDASLDSSLKAKVKRLEDFKPVYLQDIEDTYKLQCQKLNVKPQELPPTKEEIRLSGFIPVRTKKMGNIMDFWELREKIQKLKYSPPPAIMMASFELRNFIDGKKSILEIRNAASAEYEPLPLPEVENYVKLLEKLGMVEIKTK